MEEQEAVDSCRAPVHPLTRIQPSLTVEWSHDVQVGDPEPGTWFCCKETWRSSSSGSWNWKHVGLCSLLLRFLSSWTWDSQQSCKRDEETWLVAAEIQTCSNRKFLDLLKITLAEKLVRRNLKLDDRKKENGRNQMGINHLRQEASFLMT